MSSSKKNIYFCNSFDFNHPKITVSILAFVFVDLLILTLIFFNACNIVLDSLLWRCLCVSLAASQVMLQFACLACL